VGVRTDWAHNQPLPMLLLQLQPHRNPVRVSLPCVDVLLQERKNSERIEWCMMPEPKKRFISQSEQIHSSQKNAERCQNQEKLERDACQLTNRRESLLQKRIDAYEELPYLQAMSDTNTASTV
jgi:hypothetical protein